MVRWSNRSYKNKVIHRRQRQSTLDTKRRKMQTQAKAMAKHGKYYPSPRTW